MNRMCFRPRPLKVALRLSSIGAHPNFYLPFQGWWAVTGIGGGGGSGATHISYANPSEHGDNGAVGNFTYAFRRTISTTVVVGDGGDGGEATNDSDVPTQRGLDGGDTQTGVVLRSGGDGGRCAFESVSLSPIQPTANYPANAYDARSVSITHFLGAIHDASSVSTSAGRGAAGRTSPALDGLKGTKGRVDYYCKG